MSQTARKPGRGRIYESITETVGDTPLVRIGRLARERGAKATILAKLEFFNPLASVKDRIGVAMIDALEASGALKPGGVLIEPTSGNTGIALAFAAAARGYRMILTMPETMSIERRKMLAFLGAELELTPAAQGMRAPSPGPRSCSARFPARSFPSSSRTRPIRRSTAPRRPRRSGTTPTARSTCSSPASAPAAPSRASARSSSSASPACASWLWSPKISPVLSGGAPGPHKIQGIGAGFVPAILDRDLIDEVVTVGNQTAFDTSRQLARSEGIPGGISSGAAMAAALEVASRDGMEGKTVVVIIPSFAERYISSALFEGV